jgi:hypothetical protein
MKTMKGGLTNHSPSSNHSNHSSDISLTLHHYLVSMYKVSQRVRSEFEGGEAYLNTENLFRLLKLSVGD